MTSNNEFFFYDDYGKKEISNNYEVFVHCVKVLQKALKPRTSLKLLLKSYRLRNASQLSFEEWNILHRWVLETIRWKLTIEYLLEESMLMPVFKRKNAKSTIPAVFLLSTYLVLFERLSPITIIGWLSKHNTQLNKRNIKELKEYLFHVSHLNLKKFVPQGGKITKLSFKYSIPPWLVKKILSQLGEQKAINLFKAYSRPPVNKFIVLNTYVQSKNTTLSELEENHIIVEKDSILQNTYLVKKNAGRILFTKSFRKNAVIFQEWGSIAIGQALPFKKHQVILDACASPGNKTLQLLLKRPVSFAIAGDFGYSRGALLKDRLYSFNVGANVSPIIYDARIPPLKAVFDSVLIDAPCTGSGTFSTHPEIKWKLKPELVSANSRLQLKILNGISNVVRKKGYLLYSTCSVLIEENENVVELFLKKNDNWELSDDFDVLVGEESDILEKSRRIFPNNLINEAYFLALLYKKR